MIGDIQPVTKVVETGYIEDTRQNHQATKQKPTVEQQPLVNVHAIIGELNNALKVITTRVAFSVDKTTGKTVVKIIDEDSEQVIRQIPPEQMLRIAQRITELLGLLVDERA
jgi:flagellar protein FlaG